ncbi:MAG: hypothetical protein LBB07_02465 [Bifidobacteriaceae bacterium]|nr:hypothetical protein [Bifidobacteriaceae bacterium]
MVQFNFNFQSLIDLENNEFMHFSMNENYTKALRRLNKKQNIHYSDKAIEKCGLKAFQIKKNLNPEKVETLLVNRILKDKIFASLNIRAGKKLYPAYMKFEYKESTWKLTEFRLDK